MTHSLVLGAVTLASEDSFTDAGWWVETFADGASFGTAAGRDVIVQTLLQDGAAVSRDGYDNRDLTFRIVIKASDALSLAEGERALAAEIGRHNELVWTPPDGWGPPSVFTVVMSSMSWEFDDWGEMEPTTYGRPYVLSLTCKPFARSVTPVVVGALVPAGDSATEVVSDGSSTSGWSGNGTVTSSGGEVSVSVPVLSSGGFRADAILTLAATVDLSLTKWIAFDYRVGDPGNALSFRAFANNTELPLLAAGPSPVGAAYARRYYMTPASMLSASSLRVEATIESQAPSVELLITQVIRTNVPPAVSSGRQQFRSLNIPGSARTEGSLQIAHEVDSLGLVAVFTNAEDGSGYQPACHQYRTGGDPSPVASPTTASGFWSALNTGTPETYDIPSRAVPEGTYAPMALLKADAASYYSVTLTASLLVGGNELGSTSATVSLQLSPVSGLYSLGGLSLPTVAVPRGSLAKVRLELSSSGAVQIDNLFNFNLTIGALSVVDCGIGAPSPGGSSNRLWIDTASLDVPRPAMWVGTQADRSDARHIEGSKVISEMPHKLPAGPVNLFTLTEALYAGASLEAYPNWHSNAAS